MDLWNSAGGMVQLRVTAADPEKILSKLNRSSITLYDIQFQDPLTCTFTVRRKDFKQVKRICTHLDVKMQAKGKYGLYWTWKKLLHRPILLLSFFIMFFTVLFLPTRVLFLRVEGNESVPARRILEAAQCCGVRFGASRREVRSEKVKNALIAAIPELQWAGINTRGCVATVSVKERTPGQQERKQTAASSIVAARDGYILSATATRGMLLVLPGQSVYAGQTLISGINDLGLIVQATVAEGEVYAQTRRELTVIMPDRWCVQRSEGREMKKFSLLIGKKRINLWKDSGISGSTCGRMYKETYVTLPGNFVLPVALCVEKYKAYELRETASDDKTEYSGMREYSANYLLQQMIAGQILHSEHRMIFDEGACLLRQSFVCREMIGIQRQEQIGDIHE